MATVEMDMDNEHIQKELVKAINRLAQAIEKANELEEKKPWKLIASSGD